MRTHALRTAMTLYESGTVGIDAAARSAGVTTERMRHRLRSSGITVREGSAGQPTAPVGR
jgi:predicted HTH domain antitoxin